MTFAQDQADAIRRDQLEAARNMPVDEEAPRRPTLRLATGAARPTAGSRSGVGAHDKKKNVLKGHEAFLKALEMNGARIEVEKCDGTTYRGILKHTDKYSITLNVTERGDVQDDGVFDPVAPRDRVIFKHDISEFSALTHRPNTAQTTGEGNA